MEYLIPGLLIWLVVGVSAGDMMIRCALDLMDDANLNSNIPAIFIMITLAGLMSLPWLVWQAIENCISAIFRRY